MTESNTKGLTRHLKREFRKQVFLIKNQEDINIIRGVYQVDCDSGIRILGT